MTNVKSAIAPPIYCRYALGPCDQDFSSITNSDAFFIYPSKPTHLARTIADGVTLLIKSSSNKIWISWETLLVGGQIIYCELCKAIRGTKLVVANITNMNFNVLFELGYTIGLAKAVLPVRDTSYESQRRQFDEIGVFDTLGFEPFANSLDLARIVQDRHSYPPIHLNPELNKSQPILFMRSPIDTDGSMKLFSSLKKSWFRFRSFDSRETPRLSLHDAYKQVFSSVTVVAHLLDPERTGAIVHNARCAFVCGLALAAGKHVMMIQEGNITQPIDYRDIAIQYVDSKAIPYYVETILRETADTIQSIDTSFVSLPTGLLERIDMGDVAAENEIKALSKYFVKTPQFQQARQGHARIVVGRKGAGKTALFYGIRGQFSPKGNKVILDLKPEGHQFTRLREMVLTKLTEGLQLHTLTAFWHYLLLLEITKKIIEKEEHEAYQRPESLELFNELVNLYEEQLKAEGDFSERLMALVDRLINNFPDPGLSTIGTREITEAIYKIDIKKLNLLLIDRLQEYDGIWILIDNIDKGFPSHGLQKPDILIIRCLLEATRRLQLSMESHNIQCLATIFIRKDVYDHLVDLTPDRGKESFVNLDWSDIELVKELLLRRFQYQVPDLKGSFEEVWSRLFDPHVNGENSLNYILSRTFLRPRDILNFVRKCIQIAVSRDHNRVKQEDILVGENLFSADMLNELQYEVKDVFPDLPDFALAFWGANESLMSEEVDKRLEEAGISVNQLHKVKDILLWFSFLGFRVGDNESYAHEVLYDVAKLRAQHNKDSPDQTIYSIHPAFRAALAIQNKIA